MYNSNFFEEEFVPSIYHHFMKTKEDENGNEKPVFISEKQFNVIAKTPPKPTHTITNMISTV